MARHGWGHVASRLGLARLLHLRGTASQEQGTPARLVQALEELGPTFIKFGQLLSTRSDLLPQGYIEELSKLQDTAPTIPIAYVREVISTELGGPPETIFAEFNDVPIAAASLGQVHSAVLHDGTQVIIKVQRPGIRDVVDRDIEILYTIASMLERRWERAKTYGLTEVVDEFAITIREELDYTREAYNTQRLRTNLSKENRARVPQVYWELVTQRVLTLERINGIKITDERGLEALGIDIKDAANALTSIFLHQI
ncbi:MAG TPA: AarF/UbiB family protein, partial [Armatimonadota bacterium]|nr:AarF/UbiB family protein [Armatimonadota bacterium]